MEINPRHGYRKSNTWGSEANSESSNCRDEAFPGHTGSGLAAAALLILCRDEFASQTVLTTLGEIGAGMRRTKSNSDIDLVSR